MPDEELFRAAERGELRKNLAQQIKRMRDDPRSEALTRNFVGQWLEVRDVDGFTINTRGRLEARREAGPGSTWTARPGGRCAARPRWSLPISPAKIAACSN